MKFVKFLRATLLSLTLVCLLALVYGFYAVPDEICTVPGEDVKLSSVYSLRFQTAQISRRELKSLKQGNYKINVKIFNTLPVKTMNMKVSQRRYVVPSGKIFGLRLFTNGVIVVGINEIETENGKINAAQRAGLKKGDAIVSINGKKVKSSSEVSSILESMGGEPFEICFERNSKQYKTTYRLEFSKTDNKYVAGLWIRDSAAGIGTMTYYYKASKIYAGLGHGVYDSDTNGILPLYNGDIVHACINGCNKGTSGKAGELCGSFSSNTCGSLLINSDCGVYGILFDSNENADEMPVALKSEVKTGKAEIISTVDSSGPQHFEIEIEKIYSDKSSNRNMIIKITDRKLIEKTGGIVQGMSGSPIVQNGMLVGAVTHVLVNDPLCGYAIFAQTMTQMSDSVLQKSQDIAS